MDQESDPDDELPPPRPFRPWDASGVPQPGAARPGGPAPPPRAPVVPAAARPLLRSESRPAHRTSTAVVGLALAAIVTTWLPWFKLPQTGVFTLAGSGFDRTANAWDGSTRFLWSYRAPHSGPSIGWLVVVLALVVIGAELTGSWRGVIVGAALEAVVATLFFVQVWRFADATPAAVSVGGSAAAVADWTGIGVLGLFAAALATVVVARR